MKFIPILFLSIFLVACTPPKIPEPVIEPAKVVTIDPAALESCALLDENAKLASFSDILAVYGDLATKYADCANKQRTSVKLLKEFGNIK